MNCYADSHATWDWLWTNFWSQVAIVALCAAWTWTLKLDHPEENPWNLEL